MQKNVKKLQLNQVNVDHTTPRSLLSSLIPNSTAATTCDQNRKRKEMKDSRNQKVHLMHQIIN